MSRPVFMVKNRVYVSAGVLPYTVNKDDDTIYFMFQKLSGTDEWSWVFEDFGGKSEDGDLSIEDVAFRECLEEMNFKPPVDKDFLQQQLKHYRSVIYRIPDSKYILYLIYMPPDLLDQDCKEYGDKNNDGTRTVEWISYSSLMNMDNELLHPRLSPAEFKSNLPLLMAQPFFNPSEKIY